MTWALAMCPVWAELVSSQTVLQGFLPNGDYVLDIDGQRSPKAEFYMAEQPPALLLVCPELPSAVLLLPGTGSVQTVSAANMTKEADGTVTLNAGSVTEQGKFQVLATWIVFSVDGHGLTLKERPWLLGQQDVSSLEKHNPEYVWREKAYTPDSEAIRKLREYPTDV